MNLAYFLERMQPEFASRFVGKGRDGTHLSGRGADGGVLCEGDADSAGMDNHLGRPEVERALRRGWGESERRSDTLSEVTLCCAARTRAGNVLRLSSARGSMPGAFLRALPLPAGILPAADRLAPPAEEKGLELRFSGEPARIDAYPRLLAEMLANLIDNAIQYTPAGGRVEVSVQNCPGGATFAVADNGVGIPKGHRGRVFERFYRVDKSHSRATRGTGLGLSVVKHGAMIHGAKIALESEAGKGTRVALIFPEKG